MKSFDRNSVITGVLFIFAAALVISPGAMAAKGGKGGGNAGGGNSGEPEPVYRAAGDLIDVPAVGYIDSTNLSFDDIIFRPSAGFTMDLGGFSVLDPGGGSCTGFSSTTTGTLVLAPGDVAATGSPAELRFGFQGQLSSNGVKTGKTVQHYLIMQGTMDGSWPPLSSPETYLTFTSWSISAENKNSQKSDCEGDGDITTDPVLIGIWLSN